MTIDKVTLASRAVQGITPQPTKPSGTPPPQEGTGFEDILKAQIAQPSTVRFSAHAQRRLESRSIEFGEENVTRLEQAVDQAAEKGSKESLILMDDLALVVSVKNRVVITAIDQQNRKENVFTNIDSVVLT
jgi:flagellar operon protein